MRPALPERPIALKYNNTNAVLKLTTLLTNSLVNELHAAGQRNGQHGSDSTPATPQSIGQATIVPTMTELPVTVIFNGPSLNGSLYPSNSPTDQTGIWRPDFVVARQAHDSGGI